MEIVIKMRKIKENIYLKNIDEREILIKSFVKGEVKNER